MIYVCVLIVLVMVLAMVALLVHHRRASRSTADIDLRRSARPRLTVQLPSGPRLTLSTPTKALADACSSLGGLLEDIGSGNVSDKNIDALYSHCAAILAGNQESYTVSVQRLKMILSPDDCIDFLDRYLSWLTGLINQKN